MERKEDNGLSGLDPAELLKQGAGEDTFTENHPGGFTPPTLEELSEIFPRFEILELIGRGGMGAVYRVRQPELDRIVALKILPPSIAIAESFPERFTREAKAMAKLNHTGIVTIHEFGREGDLYYFLMEYVDGVNLRQLLENGRISPREAMAIVPQICDALQFAHDQGIVHRDIKPENLLLDRLGRVKVADFGIAKLIGKDDPATTPTLQGTTFTEHGKVMGTPQYMAPEQTTSPTEVDHRADIFALGVVFYQMLTGELPEKDLQAPSTKVRIDVRLDEIVLRALEKDPKLRFSNATEMRTGIDELGDPGTPPVLPAQNYSSVKKRKSTTFKILATLGILFFMGIASLITLWFIYYNLGQESSAKVTSRGTDLSKNQLHKEIPKRTKDETRALELAEKSPPVLRALDWQYAKKEDPGARWLPSGRVDTSGVKFPPAVGMGVPRGRPPSDTPRYLNLWFSHPLVDDLSTVHLTLFEKDGETPLKIPYSLTGENTTPADSGHGRHRMDYANRCVGTMNSVPANIHQTSLQRRRMELLKAKLLFISRQSEKMGYINSESGHRWKLDHTGHFRRHPDLAKEQMILAPSQKWEENRRSTRNIWR